MGEGRFHAYARVRTAGVTSECSIRADSRLLVIDRYEIPRRKLVGAVMELVGPGDMCCVSIVQREGLAKFSTISIDVSGRENASELVHALGLSAEQGALSVWVNQPAAVDIVVVFAITFAAFFVTLATAFHFLDTPSGENVPVIAGLVSAVTLIAVIVSLRILFRARITVGLDGVSRRTWRTREHVSFDAVDSVMRTAPGAALSLKNGALFHLLTSMSQDATIGELLYRRIWQGHFAHSELCKKQSTIDDVRTVGASEWVRSLRENPESRPRGYRAPARELPHLQEAVVDITQPVQVRVGAAIALRAREGNAAADRIRAAASASASPELRVLFERIAEEASEEEIARRIEQLA